MADRTSKDDAVSVMPVETTEKREPHQEHVRLVNPASAPDNVALAAGPATIEDGTWSELRKFETCVRARAYLALAKAVQREQEGGYYGSDSLSSFWISFDDRGPLSDHHDRRDDHIAPQPPNIVQIDPYRPDLPGLPTLEDHADQLLADYFVYGGLRTPTSIRVFEILENNASRRGNETTPVGRMHVVDLRDEPAFSALSYTWGLPQLMYRTLDEKPDVSNAHERCYPIICNDHVLMVTKNLYDALQVIQTDATRQCLQDRCSFRQQNLRFVWIDAICINQENQKERSAQVEMMDEIYKHAQIVLIWLGPHSWYSQPALECCSVIAELSRKLPGEDLSTVDIYSEEWWQAQCLAELTVGVSGRPHWEALYVFLQHSWFRRSWIVQEVALARQALLLCGWAFIGWRYFAQCCRWLHSQGWHVQMEKSGRWLVDSMPHIELGVRLTAGSSRSKRDLGRCLTPESARANHFFVRGERMELPVPAIIDVLEAKDFCQSGKKVPNQSHSTWLRETLELFRSFEATDSRDKIYAFLSISETVLQHPLPPTERPIRVAYETKARQEVFTEATSYILSSCWSITNRRQPISRNTEILWQVESRSCPGVDCLPSWVPDFGVPCVPEPFAIRMAEEWNVWPLNFRLSEPPRVTGTDLRSTGVFIDEVVAVAASKGDLLHNTMATIAGLPATYKTVAKVEGSLEYGFEDPEASIEDMQEELLSEEFLSEFSIARTEDLQGGDQGSGVAEEDDEALHEAFRMIDQLKEQMRGDVRIRPSPRPQSLVEALWRTVLLGYCCGDPPSLGIGFALGDWIARRIKEALLTYMLRRNNEAKRELQAELRIWGILDAVRPQSDELELCWPADTQDDVEKLQQYDRDEWMASTCLCEFHDRIAKGLPVDVEVRQSTIETLSLVMSAAPIRFVPKWEQLKAYLLRPTDTPYAQSRRSRQVKFFEQYNKYNAGRRVFRTKSGWLGNGHQSARPGDQVWYLPHCTVPFILRPVEDEYSELPEEQEETTADGDPAWEDMREGEGIFNVIGACYVHGLMHREGGFDENDPDVVRTIVIE